MYAVLFVFYVHLKKTCQKNVSKGIVIVQAKTPSRFDLLCVVRFQFLDNHRRHVLMGTCTLCGTQM